MGALNSGASSWMWDWEDAGGDYKDQLYQAWRHLKQILAHEWDGKSYEHPTKKRSYKIETPKEKWPTIFHRVPGLHLRNRQITVDGEETPAMIPALVIHALNNYETQKRNGSGIYYYVPKIEHGRSSLWVCCLSRSKAMGIPADRIKKLTSAPSSRCNEVIQWVLRENISGPNVGGGTTSTAARTVHPHPSMSPEPSSVTDDRAVDVYYTRAMRCALWRARRRLADGAQSRTPGARERQQGAT